MKAVSIFFGLFAFSTLISQSLMDLFSTLFCLTFLGVAFARRDGLTWHDLFPRLGIEWLWLGWFLVVAASFAVNAGPETPWLMRLVEFKWILILYPMIGFLYRRFPGVDILLWVLPIVALVDVYSIVSWFRGADLVTGTIDGRAGGPFANAMTYAHSTMMVVCLLGGPLLEIGAVPARLKRWLIVVFLFTSVCFLLSFTRGAWLGLFFAAVVTLFVRRPLWGAIAAVAGTAIAGLLTAIWPIFRHRVFRVFAADSYDHERITLWKTNFIIWRENPILGIGYGENARRLREYYDLLGVPPGTFEGHAHNQFLHLAAGSGLLGLLSYLLVFGFFMNWNLRLLKTSADTWVRGLLWGTLAAQIAFLIGGLTEANFEHSKVRFMLMFVWAILAAIGLRHGATAVRPRPA